MKKILTLLLLSIATLLAGQSIASKKCNICGKSLAQCQYKGRHPKLVIEDKCEKCGKTLSQCQYNGQHPASKVEKKKHNQSKLQEREVSFGCISNNAIIYVDDKKWSINDHIVLSDGNHHVVVMASGYYKYSETIKVDSKNTYFYFRLVRDNHCISVKGTVCDRTGMPLTGAVVFANTSNISSKVDDQGRYRLDNVTPGEDIEVIVDGKKYTQKAKSIVDFIIEKIIKVNGIILDRRGDPIIGANILIKGTDRGVISDIDGKFRLDVPENSELIVSYIGFKTQILSVEPSMSIVLKKK